MKSNARLKGNLTEHFGVLVVQNKNGSTYWSSERVHIVLIQEFLGWILERISRKWIFFDK